MDRQVDLLRDIIAKVAERSAAPHQPHAGRLQVPALGFGELQCAFELLDQGINRCRI